MTESVLTRKNVSVKLKITVKMSVSAVIIALAVGLPQLVHVVAARRMFTRLAMGIRDRYRFATFKFRYNFARGQRYARRRQTALYDSRTCRIRRGIRRVFKAHS